MTSKNGADSFLWNQPADLPQAASRQAASFEVAPPPAAPRVVPTPVPDARVLNGDVIDISPVHVAQNAVPSGMFEQWPLDVLLKNEKPFTGLVVLINVGTSHGRSSRNEGLYQSVMSCVAGMLGANEFGCRTTDDEFVMVCTGLQGAEAQRRLKWIADQLWEHQQRGQGTFSLLFSWGGIGVEEATLRTAMASAVNRMNRINPKRNRVSMDTVRQHRKSV